MLADVDLSTVAELMRGHRASLLLALIGGRPLAASELAARTGISRSLASTHLSRLLDGGLIAVTQRGRERYYRLANAHVAEAIEGLLTLAPHRAATSDREAKRGRAIRYARTCYDHIAGQLGVALTDALQRQRIIMPNDNSYRLTTAGRTRLHGLGLDIAALLEQRRAFARPCQDWSERRPHLAGALGAGLANRFLELDWIRRNDRDRALRITPRGRRSLRDELALNLPPGYP
jgi:DNA-binding transcriptional ArsR family regulator